MLQSIYIQNYALIDKLEMNFYPGFSVITGETGAGKTTMVRLILALIKPTSGHVYIAPLQ